MKTADDNNFVLWSRDADISSECITASKIDKIWEVQSGSSSNNRKLADGYTLSNYPTGTSVKCDKNDLNGEADGVSDSVYRVSETGTLRHYPSGDIAGSWDSNWEQWKTIGDCEGLTLGDDMAMKPSGDPAPSSTSDPVPYTPPDLSGTLTESEILENTIEGLGPNCGPIPGKSFSGNSDANLACKAREFKHLCESETDVSSIVKSGYLSNKLYFKFNELCVWDDEQAEEILDLQASASGDVVSSVSCDSKHSATSSIPSIVKMKFSGLPSTGYTETVLTVSRGFKSKIENTTTGVSKSIQFVPSSNWEASEPVAERDFSTTIYKASFTDGNMRYSKEFTVGEQTIMSYSFDFDGMTVTAYVEDWLCKDGLIA